MDTNKVLNRIEFRQRQGRYECVYVYTDYSAIMHGEVKRRKEIKAVEFSGEDKWLIKNRTFKTAMEKKVKLLDLVDFQAYCMPEELKEQQLGELAADIMEG